MYVPFPFPPSLLKLGTAHYIHGVFFCDCESVHGPQSHTPLGNHPNMLVSPQQVDLRVLLHQRGRCHHSSLLYRVWGLRSSPTSQPQDFLLVAADHTYVALQWTEDTHWHCLGTSACYSLPPLLPKTEVRYMAESVDLPLAWPFWISASSTIRNKAKTQSLWL